MYLVADEDNDKQPLEENGTHFKMDTLNNVIVINTLRKFALNKHNKYIMFHEFI